jgi:hypothetical protein
VLEAELAQAQASQAIVSRRRALAEAQLAAIEQREAADIDALHRLLQLATDGLEEARAELAQRDASAAARHTLLSANEIVQAALLFRENQVLQQRLDEGDFASDDDEGNYADDGNDDGDDFDDDYDDDDYDDGDDYDDDDYDDGSCGDSTDDARVFLPAGAEADANVSGDRRQFVQLEGWATGTHTTPQNVDADGKTVRNFPALVGPSNLASRLGVANLPVWLQVTSRGVSLVDQRGRCRLAAWGFTEIRRFVCLFAGEFLRKRKNARLTVARKRQVRQDARVVFIGD